MLEMFSLEEIFEQMDITPEEVLELLLKRGYQLPPYLEDYEDGSEEQEES